MNRRIEIVFDASGSMSQRLGKKTKVEIAKKIFSDEILPQINNESNVYLRVLPPNCRLKSSSILLSNNQSERALEINKIITNGSRTPLYQTIKEAIDDSISGSVDELKLIILSDGGDNCSSKINEVIDWNKIKESNLLGSIIIELGQIGSVGRNSLQSLANRINAHRTLIGNDGRINKTQIKKSIQKGLRSANIIDGKLAPCYDKKLKGDDLTWGKLNELYSISRFHANVLFKRSLLDFDPYKFDILRPYQVKQIEFLYKIIFKSDIDIETAFNMLHNLKSPYYYDHECIRWDFDKAMWVPIIKQEINEVKISDFSKKEILSQVSVNDFSKEELLKQVSINDFPKSDLLSKVKPEDFSVSDLISALKSKDFSRDEKKQLQEIVEPSSQVFSNKAFYRVKEIKSDDLISENIPTKEFELKLVESERREFDYQSLRDSDIVRFH